MVSIKIFPASFFLIHTSPIVMHCSVGPILMFLCAVLKLHFCVRWLLNLLNLIKSGEPCQTADLKYTY